MNFKNKVLLALSIEPVKKLSVFFLFSACLFTACDLPEPRNRRLIKNQVFVTPQTQPEQPVLAKDTSYLEAIFQNAGLVDIHSLDTSIRVRLQYADTTNFLKRAFYDGLRRAYFSCETALRIASAQYYLRQIRPELSLIIYDASRPQHIQQMMWDSLRLPDTEKIKYLSEPGATSLHNYGCAVDCGLINSQTGELLDMGSGYDTFEKLSQPYWEKHYLSNGRLSQTAYENRLLLRKVMKRAKMNSISTEWWHFSAYSREKALSDFNLIK